MKRFVIPTLLMLCLIGLIACDGCDDEEKGTVSPKSAPLNLTVFIDLSDRVERQLVPSQMERDTAIINVLVDHFVNACVKQKIVPAKDRMRVLFYPTPANGTVVNLAANLEVDMSTIPATGKKKTLIGMKKQYDESLAELYDEVLSKQDFPGCDIWEFFSSKKVNVQCIRGGYRNVLVVLTDGYLYHQSSKIQQGTAYSYVLPQTLKVPNSSLIVKRTEGLEDLEVLMLEVNPYTTAERDKLLSVLETWLNGMGVGKVSIVETDIISNVKPYIDAFIKQ